MGATAARIRHSCIPHVRFHYVTHRRLVIIHTIKAIPTAKEMFSDDERATFDVTERRKGRLISDHGFLCICGACEPRTAFWQKSDDRRRGLAKAWAAVREAEQEDLTRGDDGTAVQTPYQREALSALEILLLKEGLVEVTLANTYKSMAKWAARHG